MRRGLPAIRLALVFAFLLGSLTLVVWRQSHALALLSDLDRVRRDRVVEEARRSALLRRLEQLESRTRVSEEAGQQFGMRLPTGEEIVILPLGIRRPAGLAAAEPSRRGAGKGGG